MTSLGRLLWSVVRAPVKGALGEAAVKVGAGLTLPSDKYHKFHDVTLPTRGGTAQIDHVFVSVFGVFVVETKNLGGWIYGSERDKTWTQIFPGGKKVKFMNPLRQNYGHQRALDGALAELGLPSEAVQSVVVFVGDAELKRRMPPNVTIGLGAARYIRSFRTQVLTEEQVTAICAIIESGRLPASRSTTREHVKNVNDQHHPGRAVCPRCGRKMVLRTARRGSNAGKQFLGCEGFPRCRFVRTGKGT